MVARLVGDTLMDECPACHGVWLDAAAVARLVKERREVSTHAVLGMGGPTSRAVSAPPPGRVYVKCPECDQVMNRTNFAKRSGIIIDSCRGHGTWFDADELPRVVEFIRDGGIEASIEKGLRQEKDAARKERAKARAAQLAAAKVSNQPQRRHRGDAVDGFVGLLGIIGSALID